MCECACDCWILVLAEGWNNHNDILLIYWQSYWYIIEILISFDRQQHRAGSGTLLSTLNIESCLTARLFYPFATTIFENTIMNFCKCIFCFSRHSQTHTWYTLKTQLFLTPSPQIWYYNSAEYFPDSFWMHTQVWPWRILCSEYRKVLGGQFVFIPSPHLRLTLRP